MTSLLKVDNIAPSAGGTEFSLTRGVAKAWCNLDGTGTVTVNDSLNVSSITDSGAGIYTTNLSSSMSGAGYSVSGNPYRDSNTYHSMFSGSNTASGFRSVFYTRGTSTAVDSDTVFTIAHGDLA